MHPELQRQVADLVQTGNMSLAQASYEEAADRYKQALRLVRDELGVADLLIADLFELLSLVHAATGRYRKCSSIDARVQVIRAMHRRVPV